MHSKSIINSQERQSMLPSCKNQLTDLDWEPIDWFLHDENTRSCLDFCC